MNAQEASRVPDRILLRAKATGTQPHHPSHEHGYAVDGFIEIHRSGARAPPGDVGRRAIAEGWSEEHARDLGEMAPMVRTTLLHSGVVRRH